MPLLKIFVCGYTKTQHLYRKPKLLPCGKSVCSVCINKHVTLLQTNLFKCKFCEQIHDYNRLELNEEIQNKISNNVSFIMTYQLGKLNEIQMKKTETAINHESIIETKFIFIQDEIELKIESLKCMLEETQMKLNKKVKKIKKYFKKYLKYFYKKSKTMKRGIMSDKEVFKKYDKFEDTLAAFKFKASDILPSCKSICYLSEPDSLDFYRLRNKAKVTTVDLTDMCKYPTGICSFSNDRLIVVDQQQSEIFLLNQQFYIIKRVSYMQSQKHGYVRFNGPRAVCTNNKNRIYISDCGNDRICVFDMEFNECIDIIGKHGKLPGEFDWPTDMAFHDELLYVLDENNYRIQLFDSSGLFLNQIDWQCMVSCRNETFRCMSISSKYLALMNKMYINLCDFDGKLKQKIYSSCCSFRSCAFINGSYLIIHQDKLVKCSKSGALYVYELNTEYDSDKNNEIFIFLFDRSIAGLENSSSSMLLFDNNLVLSCMCDCSLAII